MQVHNQHDQGVSADGNRILWSTYPEGTGQWIKRHGGPAFSDHHAARTEIGGDVFDRSLIPIVSGARTPACYFRHASWARRDSEFKSVQFYDRAHQAKPEP
jgi:hypothetical protein